MMAYTITYSADRNKPIDAWTEEVFENQDEAEQTALELLYSGFYVSLDEQY